MKLNRVVQQIRGKKGSLVRLRIIPADAPDTALRVECSLTRDEIKLTEQEAKAKIIEKPVPGGTVRLGYIDLPSFYMDAQGGPDGKSASRDVRKLLLKLRTEKVAGLLLDLRRNTGGSLPDAIALTGLFIERDARIMLVDTAAKNHSALSFFRRSGFGGEIRHVYLSQNLENDPRYIQRNDDASEDDTDD